LVMSVVLSSSGLGPSSPAITYETHN
jgi:hypothetical protein